MAGGAMSVSARSVGEFVAEICAASTKASVPMAELRDAYETWCRRRRMKPSGRSAFSRELTKLGYMSGREGRKQVRLGLKIAPAGHKTVAGRVRVPDVAVMNHLGHPTPPPHLSPAITGWWLKVAAEYDLSEEDLRILTNICELWDHGQAARAVIEREGMTYKSSHGGIRERPEVRIMRQSAEAHARLLKILSLDEFVDDDSDDDSDDESDDDEVLP